MNRQQEVVFQGIYLHHRAKIGKVVSNWPIFRQIHPKFDDMVEVQNLLGRRLLGSAE